jgi:uncharacterized SAM-binding protein YcdF (DUF218 family)
MSSRAQSPWLKRARRTRRLRVVGRIVTLAILALIVYVVVTFVQVVQAANRDETGEAAEAIIVLGAAQYDGRPSSVLQARLDHAAALHGQGVAPVVVVTGGSRPGDRFTEAQAAAEYLRAKGVPESALRREVDGANSYESLAAASRFLRDEGITEVVLVSSPYHALRTVLIAEEVGLSARPSPADVGSEDVGATIGHYARETAAVAAGRVVGYRRLVGLDDRVAEVRSGGISG